MDTGRVEGRGNEHKRVPLKSKIYNLQYILFVGMLFFYLDIKHINDYFTIRETLKFILSPIMQESTGIADLGNFAR